MATFSTLATTGSGLWLVQQYFTSMISMPLFSDVMCTGFAPECCFHSLCRPKRAAERHAGEDYCKKKRSNPSYKALGVTIAFEQSWFVWREIWPCCTSSCFTSSAAKLKSCRLTAVFWNRKPTTFRRTIISRSPWSLAKNILWHGAIRYPRSPLCSTISVQFCIASVWLYPSITVICVTSFAYNSLHLGSGHSAVCVESHVTNQNWKNTKKTKRNKVQMWHVRVACRETDVTKNKH